VLQRVATVACRVTDVQEAVILLREGKRGRLTAVARHGRIEHRTVWHAEEGPVGRALASGAPAADVAGARRLRAAAPLIVGGRTAGVLAVSGTGPAQRFPREHLDLLADLAEIAASSLEGREARTRVDAVLDAGAELLERAVDSRDEYTGRHSAKVGSLARRVGQRIGMEPQEIELLECAARLHDVGKLGVPESILRKPGPLDEREWTVMRRHPEWGAQMVARVPGLEGIAALVRGHHERWDGRGYPDGLEGDGIPLGSRVISVCDALEAMVARRPYRAPLSLDAALGELLAGSGSQFDPAVVAAVEAESGTGERLP
jgi:HD-GYP domain-containing protein (c-di-GMP phosphodiesterase class II)